MRSESLKVHTVVDDDGGDSRRSAVDVGGSVEHLDHDLALVAIQQEGVASHQVGSAVGLGLNPLAIHFLDELILAIVGGQSGVGLLDHVGAAGGDARQLHGHLDVVAGQVGTKHSSVHGSMTSSSGAGDGHHIAQIVLGSGGSHTGVGSDGTQDGGSSVAGQHALQSGGRVSLTALDAHTALNGQNFGGQGTLSHHDVGSQGMHGIAVVAIDDSIVLEVLVGDELLGGGNHHEVQPGVLRHVHGGHDVHTILGGGVDAEVVGDLHTGDLSVVGEDPVDVLQVAHQVGVAVADDNHIIGLQLGLQAGEHTLEVLAAVAHPVGDVVGEGVIGQSVELAADDQAVAVQEADGHGASIGLGLERGIQEVTDLEVLELGQGTAHHIDVIGDDVDVLGHQGIGSVLDGDGGVQAVARFGHDELNGLDTPDGGQGTIVPAVSNLAAQGDVGHIAILAQDGDLTGHEVHSTEDLVSHGGNHIAVGIGLLVVDITLGPLMGGDVGPDIGGNHGAVGQGDGADADVLSQLDGRIILNDAGNVGRVDQGQAMQSPNLDGSLSNGGAGAGSRQGPGDGRVVVHIGDGVLSAVLGPQVTLLHSVVDDGRGRNLGHQNVLEHGGNPLLLQEEGIVSHDGAVAGHDGLDGHSLHGVVLQLAQPVGVVVVETAVDAVLVHEDGRRGDGLHNVVHELLPSGGIVQNAMHHVIQADAAALIGLQNLGNLRLEAQRAVRRIVVTGNMSIGHVGQIIASSKHWRNNLLFIIV